MTRCANVGIRREGHVTLFDARRARESLHRHIFWGPDIAEEVARAHPSVPDGTWCDELSAGSGMALDVDHQRIVFYGGDRLSVQPHRDVFVGLMASLWRRWGWEVRWAQLGLAHVAAQLGAAPEAVAVHADSDRWPAPDELRERSGQRGLVTTIVTDRQAGRIIDRVADLGAAELVLMGPSLLEAAEDLPEIRRWDGREVEPGWRAPSFVGDTRAAWPASVTSSVLIDRRDQRVAYAGLSVYGELQRQRQLWRDSNWAFDYLGTGDCEFCAHFRRQGRQVPSPVLEHGCRAHCAETDVVEDVAEHLFRNTSPVARADVELRNRRFGWALSGWSNPAAG